MDYTDLSTFFGKIKGHDDLFLSRKMEEFRQKPEICSKLETIKPKNIQQNFTEVLYGRNTQLQRGGTQKSMRKTKNQHIKSYRSKKNDSFTQVKLNDIKDKILKAQGTAPHLLKRVANPSLCGIRKMVKKKSVLIINKLKQKVPEGPPSKILYMLESLHESKVNQTAEVTATLDHLKEADDNFDDKIKQLKQDLLKWVDSYVEDYKENHQKEIKTERANALKQYDTLTTDIVNIGQLVLATQSSIDNSQTISSLILKRIQKCFNENEIEDLDIKKHTALLLEKELNKNEETDIAIKFGGYQGGNTGIYSPQPFINKYKI